MRDPFEGCPSHRLWRGPSDECPWCEQAIERAEYNRSHGDDEDGTRAAERRYERHLDEMGGSR